MDSTRIYLVDTAYEKYKLFSNDGKILAEGKFKLDRNDYKNKIGEWRDYYPNGTLNLISHYGSFDLPVGDWKFYYENGLLSKEENYVLIPEIVEQV